MADDKPLQRMTAADYLQIERAAETKSEFRAGEIFAMAGGTFAHSLIAANLLRRLGNALEGRPCLMGTSDLRVKVEMAGAYAYPDISVVCGEREFEDERRDVLLNPCVIVEILSDSTESYDRGKKFELYRLIPSLREYLLVSQREPHIEQYVRQAGGGWLLGEAKGMEARITLPSLGVELPLAEVFAHVEFPPIQLTVLGPDRA